MRTSLTIVLLSCVAACGGCSPDTTQAATDEGNGSQAAEAIRALTVRERAQRPPEPERPDSDAARAVRALREVLAHADFDSVYEHFDADSRARLDEILIAQRSRVDGGLDETALVLGELLRQARAWGWRGDGMIERVIEDRIHGDRATVVVRYEDGGTRAFELTLEDGAWRVDLSNLLAGIEQMTEAILLQRLHMLRLTCDQYFVAHGRAPDFDGSQWEELLDGGYLRDVPRNPHARAPISTLVVVLTEPGLTGTAVDPMEAGWVWNAPDQMLYATGRGGF